MVEVSLTVIRISHFCMHHQDNQVLLNLVKVFRQVKSSLVVSNRDHHLYRGKVTMLILVMLREMHCHRKLLNILTLRSRFNCQPLLAIVRNSYHRNQSGLFKVKQPMRQTCQRMVLTG